MDNEIFADLFDLDPLFCDSLNSSLFDGELPAKLYTHIKIKEDDNDEAWFSAAFPRQPTCSFGNNLLPVDGDEPLELMDELFSPSAKSQVDENKENKSFKGEEISVVISAKVTDSVAYTNISTKTFEDSADPKEGSSDVTEQKLCKRELRTRRKRIHDSDHDYCKSSVETNNTIDSEEDDKVDRENEEYTDNDDEDDDDFKAPCSAKKARRTNSKSTKDAQYWERRKRNNLAAKRSREAKREREIQIAEKTAALEKENANLKKQVRKLKADIKRAEKRLRIMV